MPDPAMIAAATVLARANLGSALIGKRIDDPVPLGPICHKVFALPLNPRRAFEEELNQSFKKLVIITTSTKVRRDIGQHHSKMGTCPASGSFCRSGGAAGLYAPRFLLIGFDV
jgi:hypothetical protein